MSTVRWYGNIAKSRARAAAVETLQTVAKAVYDGSQALVPVSRYARGGFTKASGRWQVDPTQLRGVVSYDTRSSGKPIASYVHERMDVHHPQGQAKYLEEPLNEASELYGEELAARLDKALR